MERDRNYLIELLGKIIDQAVEYLSGLDEKEVKFRSEPGKWSKQEILGHLIDSAINNHRRFVIALKQEHLVFDGYDQDEWVRMNEYNSFGWRELIEYWVLSNRKILATIRSYPENRFIVKFDHHNFHRIAMKPIPQGDPTSLKDLLADYIYHTEHHLGQIIDGYERLFVWNSYTF